MKRFLLLLSICALCVSGASAQNEKQARKVLDKTANTLKQKGGASASFTLSNTKTGTIKGTIVIKGNKFKTKTSAATVWFDGKTQWTYLAKNEEVNITTPSKSQQQAMNPYAFINIYRSGYNLSLKQKGNNYEVHLTAQNKTSGISEMYLTINKSLYTLSQVRVKQKSTWSSISISNFKTQKLSDKAFVFNAKEYPNAEIVDLR